MADDIPKDCFVCANPQVVMMLTQYPEWGGTGKPSVILLLSED
jgi:hypothetical protein